MDSDPELSDGVHASILTFARNFTRGVESCASVNEMENNVLVHEQQIALDLLVEGVRDVNVRLISRSRLVPLTAHLAGLTYLRNDLQDFVWYSNSLEKFLHRVRGCMPPAGM